jgi:CRP-like cAMP-binding protein
MGLALRNLFADIFTGLAVNLDHTFRIGDWIEVSEGGGATVGQIEEIGWRSTHLRTEDQKMVVIPNSYLGIHRVTNVSRPSPATRFQVTVTIDFSVPVSRARRVLLASLHAVHDLPGFLAEKEPEVLAADVNDHGLEYLLRYWITPWAGISPSRARDVVTTSAMEHLRTAGITPAYEKTDIFHRDMPLRNSNGHTREDQLGLLARLDLFSMLDQVEIGTIADASRRRHFHAGEVLFRQGDPGDSLFILTEGLLDVFIDEGNGAAQRVGRVLPGEFVGEMSLLTGEPRSATIRALTPCVAYEIGGDVVRALLELRPQIAEVLSHVVAERRLRNADARAQAGANGQQEVSSFARQLLVRMRSFFGNRAPARDATHPAQPAGNGDAHRRTSSEAD